MNGAPNVLLDLCTHIALPSTGGNRVEELTAEKRAQIMTQVDNFSDDAYRVIATAYKGSDEQGDGSPAELEQGLTFAGLVASIDPERVGVKESIVSAHAAGVRVCMITGDYLKTAMAIAKKVGILEVDAGEGKAIDCGDLRVLGSKENDLLAVIKETPKDATAQAELTTVQADIDRICDFTDVYARAKPIDKITIVRSYQRQGHVVAMTGDGVNDGPALSQADIGVAMGESGTDVARGCADMVLTDDNFVSIVDAIEEGRAIYSNIGKFCYFLLSTNIGEVFAVLFAVIGGYPTLLDPVQILWLNLTTDGAPAIALAVEAGEPGTMTQGPRRKSEPLIEKVILLVSICLLFASSHSSCNPCMMIIPQAKTHTRTHAQTHLGHVDRHRDPDRGADHCGVHDLPHGPLLALWLLGWRSDHRTGAVGADGHTGKGYPGRSHPGNVHTACS